VTDHFGLLVNFLGHEVAIIRLVDQRGCGAVLEGVAVNHRIVLVKDSRAIARQDDPVAVLEITDRVGERAERNGVRTEIHFAFAIADRKRRSVACADHQIVIAGEDKTQRKCATKLRQRRLDRLDRFETLREIIVDKMQNDFGVGLGLENRPLFLQGLPQLAKILDDPVMNNCDASGRVRMGVVLGRLAVRGPARVSDAGMAAERLGLQSCFEILEFPLGAAAFDLTALERGDACGIVTAIFEALERIHQLLRDRSTPENADNAAHAGLYLQKVEGLSKTKGEQAFS
jgi:hypothetical protein